MADAPAPEGSREGKTVGLERPQPDRRLSKARRLLRSTHFRQAFDGGERHVGRFAVLWTRRAADATLRLGVVASRRTFNRSVDRSRAKRLLREAFRLNRYRLSGACDVVLVARRSILAHGTADVERDLMALAAKAGLLGKGST